MVRLSPHMYPSPEKNLNYETEDAVYFFTGPFFPLDNFSAHSVEIWGNTFPTAEHAFQWKKYETTETGLAEAIRVSGSPELAKKISRGSENKRQDWQEIRLGVMADIIRAKAAQHEDVREMLLRTGDKLLVENSPVDSFWGCGEDGKGENYLGKILMAIRDELFSSVLNAQ